MNFFRSFSSFASTSSPADPALVLTNEGNITQPRQNNGLVKAMIYANGNGTIQRCYNGITNSSSGNCGFTITQTFFGKYIIDFGFPVNDRFISVTAEQTVFVDSGINISSGFYFVNGNPNRIAVKTNITDVTFPDSFTDAAFMIIVF